MKKTLMGLMAMALLMVAILVPTGTALAKRGAPTIWVPADHLTIQDAVGAASAGDVIKVTSGTYAGAIIDKAVRIVAAGDVVIDTGPNSHSFLRAGFLFLGGGEGSGSHIEGFQFVGANQDSYVDDGKLDFPIFSRGADNVTITHNTMTNSLQGVTNWHGGGWVITHNRITDLRTINGGGIGILIGSNNGGTANDNVVSHNTISGTLHVSTIDNGGYDGTGIVLYADFRWSREGAAAIENNRVVKNKISLTSDDPEVVDVHAMELTDTLNDEELDPVILNNAVGFNDWRGTEAGIALTPDNLGDVNDISRNLGANRGHGLSPSVFGPGGN